MTSTPPVNSRIKTPPTPLHGSKYSSRHTRSSSLAKQDTLASPPRSPTGLHSPGAESHDVEDKKAKKGKGRIATGTAPTNTFNGDPFGKATPSPAKKLRFKVPPPPGNIGNPFQKAPFASNGAEAYPTPAKTPSRKRKLLPPNQMADLDAASRVLFGTASSSTSVPESVSESVSESVTQQATTKTAGASTTLASISEVEELLSSVRASPKKKRKGNRGAIFTDPFCEPLDLNDRGRGLGDGGEIQIYTDSNERIPEYDPSPDNPFIDHPEDSQEDGSDPEELKRKLRKRRIEVKEEFKKAGGSRKDGMLYMFRGKKIFRKFEKDDSSLLGRVEPRVLFPSAKQLRERELASADEDLDDLEEEFVDEGVATELEKDEDEVEDGTKGKEKALPTEVGEEPKGEQKQLDPPSTPKHNLRKTPARVMDKTPTAKGKDKRKENYQKDEKNSKEPGSETEDEPSNINSKTPRASSVAPSVSSVSSTILNFGNRPKITKSASNLSTNSDGNNISGGSFKMVDGLRRSKRLYTEEHEHIQDARTALAKKLAGGKKLRSEGQAEGSGNGEGLDVERWAVAASGPTRKKSRN